MANTNYKIVAIGLIQSEHKYLQDSYYADVQKHLQNTNAQYKVDKKNHNKKQINCDHSSQLSCTPNLIAVVHEDLLDGACALEELGQLLLGRVLGKALHVDRVARLGAPRLQHLVARLLHLPTQRLATPEYRSPSIR